MGTNFYMTPEVFMEEVRNGDLSEDREHAQVHLGKSSAGWEFTFRGDKANGVIDLRSWYARVDRLAKEGYTLTNDNGSTISTPIELLKLIKEKKGAQKATPSKHAFDWFDATGNYFLDSEFC
jgi:hypothetical protein